MFSKYFSGPLGSLREEPFAIIDIEAIRHEPVNLIGTTYAGKTSMIRELVYSLGGVFQESLSFRKRTYKDSSCVFAEFGEEGQKKAAIVTLKSCLHISDNHTLRPEEYHNLVVLKYLKTATFDRQMRDIGLSDKKNLSSYSLVVTRIKGTDEIWHGKRRNSLLSYANRFHNMRFVDNVRKNPLAVNLAETDPENIFAVVELLKMKDPSFRLIYFGEGGLPEGLDEAVVKYDGQFPLTAIDDTVSKEFRTYCSPDSSWDGFMLI